MWSSLINFIFWSCCCTQLKQATCTNAKLRFYQDVNDLSKNHQAPVCWTWNYGTWSCDQTGAGPPTAHTELYSNPE